jgi:Rrf2 family iron-sulfur cluster assembly transcriptional regulator
MTVIFSKKCELALQAVLFLTTQEADISFNAGEISEKIKVPKEFVSKVLQTLTLNGIVASKKGKSGGFSLAKDPSQIKLIDIVIAIDGLEVFHKCVIGFPGCSSDTPCPVHNTWGPIRENTYNMLSIHTLEDLKDQAKNKIQNLI